MFDYWLLAAPLPPILAFAFAAALLQEAETGEFAPGKWLLSSYIATGIENVPIFIKSDNS